MAFSLGGRRIKKVQGGKRTYYRNLAQFNRTCPTRGLRGDLCEVSSLRCTREGGIARVKTQPWGPHTSGKPATWTLYFADCGVMKRHLKRRVSDSKNLL